MTELQCFATSGLNVLHQWAAARSLTYGFERSARFVMERLDTERALFSFSIQQLGAAALSDTLMICREMHAPDLHLLAIRRYFPAAAFVHFGFEASGQALSGKCYLELPNQERHPEGHGHNSAGAGRMQFLGFKWSMTDRSLSAVTRYRMLPVITWELVRQCMLSAMAADAVPALRQLLNDVEQMRVAGSVSNSRNTESPPEYRLLEVEEDGCPRRSYDVNIYDDQLQLQQLVPALSVIAEALQIPQAAVQEWLDQHHMETVGHLAAGMHRNQQSFLTVYFGGRSITGKFSQQACNS